MGGGRYDYAPQRDFYVFTRSTSGELYLVHRGLGCIFNDNWIEWEPWERGHFFWQIVPLSINVLKFISNMTFTACTIENSIDYHGNGVGVGSLVPDAHACQAYCKLNNHPFFVWLHNDHQTDPEMCFCKSSDSGRTSNAKSTAGVAQGCGGSKYRGHVQFRH